MHNKQEAIVSAAKAKFIPKGDLCLECRNMRVECRLLPFHEMKVIHRYDTGEFGVRCTDYQKEIQ